MATASKEIDPAFQGVGSKTGIEIWRIEKFQPVLLPKEEHGKFYSGDSYIVLKGTEKKRNPGGLEFAVHFWLGKATSQDEAGTAAIKAVELDAALGGRAVQYREVQGAESDLFLSYFKPCLIPLEGGVASGFKKVENEKYEPRLLQCKGRRVVRVRQVPLARASLNHDDVFVLDAGDKIYQFNGLESSKQERAKALEVVQYIKDNDHGGKAKVATVEDGKGDVPDAEEFWNYLGGFGVIPKKGAGEDGEDTVETRAGKLLSIGKDGVKEVEGGSPLKKEMLDTANCYLLDCSHELYIWTGKASTLEDKKGSMKAAEAYLVSQNRPLTTRITKVMEKNEPVVFRSNFDTWPFAAMPKLEGKSKIAALTKQMTLDTRAMVKGPQTAEAAPPLVDDGSGKLEVWRIDSFAKVPVSAEEHGRFYSGDAYIVLYSYRVEKREEYLLFFWLGRNSSTDERGTAAILTKEVDDGLRGKPVQIRVTEGKEPDQLVSLFKGSFVILKGGLSSGWKNRIATSGEGEGGETYNPEGVALFQVRGTTDINTRTVQLPAVAASLNSADVFVLQTPSAVYVWHGKGSTEAERTAAATVGARLKGTAPKEVKEEKEPQPFWDALGGKADYPSSRELRTAGTNPRLFQCSNSSGTFQATEVFSYAQEDLLTEDVMLLDSGSEIFVWLGLQSNESENKDALETAQKYLDAAVEMEGRAPETPIVRVTEGHEPPMFTCHFPGWDTTRATVFVDPYEKKLAELQGRKDKDSDQSSPINPNFARSKSFLEERVKGAESPAMTKSLSNDRATPPSPSKPQEKTTPAKELTTPPRPPPPAPEPQEAATPPARAANGDVKSTSPSQGDSRNSVSAPAVEDVRPYALLRRVSGVDLPTDIDATKREAYLSDEEFLQVMGMSKDEFYAMPKWKQERKKKEVGLF